MKDTPLSPLGPGRGRASSRLDLKVILGGRDITTQLGNPLGIALIFDGCILLLLSSCHSLGLALFLTQAQVLNLTLTLIRVTVVGARSQVVMEGLPDTAGGHPGRSNSTSRSDGKIRVKHAVLIVVRE